MLPASSEMEFGAIWSALHLGLVHMDIMSICSFVPVT